jgi:hypothetical protein
MLVGSKLVTLAASTWVNRTDIWGLGSDNQIYQRSWRNDSWIPDSGWTQHSGYATSPPAAVAWLGPVQGQSDWNSAVLALGNGTQYWFEYQLGGDAWTNWTGLGGPAYGPPVATSWAGDSYNNSNGTRANQVDAFGIGTSSSIYHNSWDGFTWTGWEDLTGTATSRPAVTAWGRDRLDVVGLGTGNMMFHKSWNSGTWDSDWTNLGGVFASPPAMVSWGPNRLDVFGISTNYSVQHLGFNGTSWDGSWQTIGSGNFSSMPAVASWGPNRLDVFVVGTDDQMYHLGWNGSHWEPSEWEPLGGSFQDAPVAVSWGKNHYDIFATGTNGSVYRKVWAGSWQPSATNWEDLGPPALNPTSSSIGGPWLSVVSSTSAPQASSTTGLSNGTGDVNNGQSSLSSSAKAGISISVISLVLILAILGAAWLVRRSRKQNSSVTHPGENETYKKPELPVPDTHFNSQHGGEVQELASSYAISAELPGSLGPETVAYELGALSPTTQVASPHMQIL